VQAEPGLRDYRKRLARRSPTDPFKQRYTAPVITAHLQAESPTPTTTTATTSSTSGSSETTTISSETATTAPSGSPSNSSPSKPSSNGGGDDETQPHLTYFTFAIDVKVSLVPGSEASSSQASNEEVSNGEGASDKANEPTIKRGVEPATPLPGKKASVITYMGAIHNAKTALFLISDDVTSVFGDGNCLSGADPCQLLGVEAGIPETFAYGYNHNRLKIEVLKIEPVVTGHS
jgi:hypothetical protein